MPPEHVAELLGPLAQRVVQLPQASGSLLVLRHDPLQLLSGEAHVAVQVPLEQTSPSAHARLHAPQWARLERRFISQPLAVLPSQLPNPVVQAANWQPDAAHVAVAPANRHASPQPPQLDTVLRAVSHPLEPIPSQSA